MVVSLSPEVSPSGASVMLGHRYTALASVELARVFFLFNW